MDRSSSTIRIRSTWAWGSIFNGSSTKRHGDDIAPPVALDEPGLAAVLPRDARHDREAKTGAARPVGGERHERLLAQLGRDRAAGIGDGELPSRRAGDDGHLDAPAAHLLRGDRGLAAEDLHGGPDPHRVE